MKLSEILPLLNNPRKTGPGRYTARCPAHDDREPSFTIRETEDGRILLHCFTGCSTSEILAALGLKISDLFPNSHRSTSAARPMPTAEQLQRRREIEQREHEETARRHWRAAEKAREIWHSAKPATDHFYLSKKAIQPHGARVGDWPKSVKTDSGAWSKIIIPDALLVPLVDETVYLFNLQAIFADDRNPLGRGKDFIAGGRKRGCFYTIGRDRTAIVAIAEGFATAASIHEATGYQTICAFDAGNLEPVARIIRSDRPDADIVICADNDKSGTGQRAARKAAAAVRGIYIEPPRELCDDPDAKSFDFNDLYKKTASEL